MTTFHIRGSQATLVEVAELLEGSAFGTAYGVGVPYPAPRRIADRTGLGQLDVYEIVVSIAINLGTAAAYDYVKHILAERADRTTVNETSEAAHDDAP